jgi:hypothetical protein
MKNSVVTTASGAEYEEEVSGALAVVEVPGGTIAIVSYPFPRIQQPYRFCMIASRGDKRGTGSIFGDRQVRR